MEKRYIPVKKLFLIMKLFIMLMTVFCLHAGAAGLAQNTITLAAKNTELSKLFSMIQQQTDYRFLYHEDAAVMSLKKNIDVKAASIENVMSRILQGTGLSYNIVNKNLVVIKTAQTARSNDLSNTRQQRLIRGVVTNDKGEPLSGAAVIQKGTTQGVLTNEAGEFSINVPAGAELEISFAGHETLTVQATEDNMKIVLQARENMDDVVIVAYGTQKKQEVVGAMTTINPGDLKVPSSNLTTALAGRLAGVIAYQRSGEPGEDNAEFFIRGVTSFGTGKKDPLILIDGIELTVRDLARMSPDDIESFSIMKDATSTALYGARGANGVILVTTKQGRRGKATINLRAENSWSSPTTNVELADPVTYMKMYNYAQVSRNPLADPFFTQEKIDATAEGLHPLIYPAVDWRKMLFKKNTINQRANMSVSGGGDVARYYVTASYAKDNGILNVDKRNNFNSNIKLNTYTLRSNVNINLTKTTELIVRLNGAFDDYRGPIDGGAQVYSDVMRSSPVLFPAYFPKDSARWYVQHIMFGYPASGAIQPGGDPINPYANMVRGYKDYSRSFMSAQLEVKQRLDFITEGLRFRTLFNTNRSSFFDVVRGYTPFRYYISEFDRYSGDYTLQVQNPTGGTEYLTYSEPEKTIASSFYWETAFDYGRVFHQKHSISGLLVGIIRQSLVGNSGSLQLSLPSRNIGLSGRATYAYDSRYAAEFNFGYNGSERFYKDKRMGFFPSAGVAWTVSNEKFWERLSKTVNLFKLRATYGLVGNDQIGRKQDRFFYLSEVNMNDGDRGMTFGYDGGNGLSGVSVSRFPNFDITWETAYKSNFGAELSLFNNKIKILADYYTENRTNILLSRPEIPQTLGVSTTIYANSGKGSGRGLDVSVDYAHQFNENLGLVMRGNYTYATTKVTYYPQVDFGDNWWGYREGYPFSQNWAYIAERLFIDESDVRNSPPQDFGTPVIGGDIKYRDINNDGIINEYDKVATGFPETPEIIYGFGFSLIYKGLDFSSFFQGLANESFWMRPAYLQPFYQNHQVLKVFADDYYNPDNPNPYALYPRLSIAESKNNNQYSTWWLRSGAFLRWKQAEIGFTFPERWTKKAKMSKLRIYGNGTNLLLLSDFKLWDVEMGGRDAGLGYPLQRVFNVGLQANF